MPQRFALMPAHFARSLEAEFPVIFVAVKLDLVSGAVIVTGSVPSLP